MKIMNLREIIISLFLLCYANSSFGGLEVKKKTVKKDKKARDPFSYTQQSSGLIPVANASIPKGIVIKAILEMKNKRPLAILKIPGYPQFFYVRENDIIRINVERNNNIKSKSSKQSKSVDIYLLVKKISGFEVKIAQRRDPENLIILR